MNNYGNIMKHIFYLICAIPLGVIILICFLAAGSIGMVIITICGVYTMLTEGKWQVGKPFTEQESSHANT